MWGQRGVVALCLLPTQTGDTLLRICSCSRMITGVWGWLPWQLPRANWGHLTELTDSCCVALFFNPTLQAGGGGGMPSAPRYLWRSPSPPPLLSPLLSGVGLPLPTIPLHFRSVFPPSLCPFSTFPLPPSSLPSYFSKNKCTAPASEVPDSVLPLQCNSKTPWELYRPVQCYRNKLGF